MSKFAIFVALFGLQVFAVSADLVEHRDLTNTFECPKLSQMAQEYFFRADVAVAVTDGKILDKCNEAEIEELGVVIQSAMSGVEVNGQAWGSPSEDAFVDMSVCVEEGEI